MLSCSSLECGDGAACAQQLPLKAFEFALVGDCSWIAGICGISVNLIRRCRGFPAILKQIGEKL